MQLLFNIQSCLGRSGIQPIQRNNWKWQAAEKVTKIPHHKIIYVVWCCPKEPILLRRGKSGECALFTCTTVLGESDILLVNQGQVMVMTFQQCGRCCQIISAIAHSLQPIQTIIPREALCDFLWFLWSETSFQLPFWAQTLPSYTVFHIILHVTHQDISK